MDQEFRDLLKPARVKAVQERVEQAEMDRAFRVMRERRRKVIKLRSQKKHTQEEAERVALELGYERHWKYWTRAVSFLMRVPERDYKIILEEEKAAAQLAAAKEQADDDEDEALDAFLDDL